jgi:hypothetical protein
MQRKSQLDNAYLHQLSCCRSGGVLVHSRSGVYRFWRFSAHVVACQWGAETAEIEETDDGC